jgi:hypothetical protein
MAILILTHSQELDTYPEFDIYIERFSDLEQRERQEEHSFVLTYEYALARTLVQIIQKNAPAQAINMSRSLKERSMIGLLTPLPTWCQEAKIEEE